MSPIRTPDSELLISASTDAANVLRDLGFRILGVTDGRLDVELDDRVVSVEVCPVAYATGPRVQSLMAASTRDDPVALVVADRITAEAREALERSGWSFLDRRGHLRLRAPGVLVDTQFAPLSSVTAAPLPDALAGKAGLVVAYRLLTSPQERLTPTKSRTGFAPSTISVALERLRQAGLMDAEGRPILPELFWALAERWQPRRYWILELPDPIEAGVDPDGPGWCLTGTSAAVEWGAPAVTAHEQFDFYVPGPAAASIALRRHGTAPDPLTAPASIAVPPVAAVTDDRGGRMLSGWRLAHPVAVALDLAQDRARGREILDDWSPAERVW
jgi:hypothetical protein